MLYTYQEAEDLIHLGAYVSGSNPKVDEAIEKIEKVRTFLQQNSLENVSFSETYKQLEAL